MEEESSRRPNFSQEETDVLVREVQARSTRIYGTASRALRADDAKAAWEKVASVVNSCCPDTLRTVAQCKKRFNDVRRRAKHKLSEHRRQTGATGGGPSTSVPLTLAEDIASSTLSSVSIVGFGGIEVGTGKTNLFPYQQRYLVTCLNPLQQMNCVHRSQTPRATRMNSEPPPFLDIQTDGFEMLERELGSLTSRVQGLEAQLQAVDDRLRRVGDQLLPLASIDVHLRQLADAAERLLPRDTASVPSRSPRLRPCIRGGMRRSGGRGREGGR
uniref:Myb-like domain-containing protein n=1 Tax=Myripristis murdjan TaxID=586833 RepID=A0A667YB98_9TELE